MARKTNDSEVDGGQSEGLTSEVSATPTTSSGVSGKKGTSKKKRARKKAAKKAAEKAAKKATKRAVGAGATRTAAADTPEEVTEETTEFVVDLDTDWNDLDSTEARASLVAAAATLAQDPRHSGSASTEDPGEPGPAEDLDAPGEDLDTAETVEATVDRGPVSTPEARDRLLAQALAHAELQDARYRVPWSDPRRTGRWKALTASVIFGLALAAAVSPPAWVRPTAPARLDASQRALSIRVALLLQAQQVEAFRIRRQRLPDTLDELPSRLPGVRFVRSGNRAYQLIAYEADGNAIVYDSADPAPPFEALRVGWKAAEAAS